MGKRKQRPEVDREAWRLDAIAIPLIRDGAGIVEGYRIAAEKTTKPQPVASVGATAPEKNTNY